MTGTFDIEQDVTLSVGGVLIAGKLISGSSYFKETAEFTKEVPHQDLSQRLRDAPGQWAAFYPQQTEGIDYAGRLKTYSTFGT